MDEEITIDDNFAKVFDDAPSTANDKAEPKANEQVKEEKPQEPTPEKQPPSEASPESEQNPVEQSSLNELPRKRGRRKKEVANCDGGSTTEVGHFSCICDYKLIAQVRAIAWHEHMTVRAVVESMFSKCIAKYEKKHGPILIEQSSSSDDLF
ncbi:MAG: hypothetical protein NC116_09525 [Clostridium sp.]|nr:hypothetical protein [Clostridium sp.]